MEKPESKGMKRRRNKKRQREKRDRGIKEAAE